MKFIDKGLVYDTEISEKVFEYEDTLSGTFFSTKYHCTLYLTPNGHWFLQRKYKNIFEYDDGYEMVVLSTAKAQEILIHNNAVEQYEKHFGKLERA